MLNDFDQWRLSRPTDFAQKVGPGTKHATPNHSYSTCKWKGSAGQNQSSGDTDQQRTANTLAISRLKNTMLNVTILEHEIKRDIKRW